MACRCPESKYLISGKLVNYVWLINTKGYASVKPAQNDFVLGEIFTLSEQDIDYLDVLSSLAVMRISHPTWRTSIIDKGFACAKVLTFGISIKFFPSPPINLGA